ncbi:hypothetical protein FHT87_000499 [Rhizobium sp. BK316]|uniref:hypothetical protein n=1 Tax=Rhizobium sp. BK316 TaxID=2587053 RepID=UPI0016144F1B|nr:hypothetical protein [Rhizobium sp. BK316]MBB3406599.1 hypothetical protein [Rhizobium sp. BK316]
MNERFDPRLYARNRDPNSQATQFVAAFNFLMKFGIAAFSPSNDQSNTDPEASATRPQALGDEKNFVLWQMKNLIYWRRAAWL